MIPFWRATVEWLIPHPVGCQCPRAIWHNTIQLSPQAFKTVTDWARRL